MRVDDPLDHRRHARLVAHVARDELAERLGVVGRVAGADHRNGTEVAQDPCDAETDTPRTTGDEHDPFLQPDIHLHSGVVTCDL